MRTHTVQSFSGYSEKNIPKILKIVRTMHINTEILLPFLFVLHVRALSCYLAHHTQTLPPA